MENVVIGKSNLSNIENKKTDYKEGFKSAINFLKKNKIQWTIIIIFFLGILISSTFMRVQNTDLLVDSTSGQRILIELDSHYFLRVAEAISQPGPLPAYDAMRAPLFHTSWIPEMLPRVLVGIYDLVKIFNPSVTMGDISVFSPVIFFFIGLIIFFLMCYGITKSKWISLIASALLAYSPAYLYRTVAGFADHDSLGMIAVFACFLIFGISLRKYEKNWKRSLLFGLLTGFFTTLAMVFWGGSITFILLVIPLSFLLIYLFNSENKVLSLIYYFSWIIGAILFQIPFNYSVSDIVHRMISSYGILVPFVLMFMIIDIGLRRIQGIKKHIKERYHEIYSLILTLIFGVIGLTILGRSIFSIITDILFKLIRPFESSVGRLGSTVAENAQPYLLDWINQIGGNPMFVIFFIGLVLIGFGFSKKMTGLKSKILFNLAWIILICSLLFSRISSSSSFNGTNFMSQFVYFIGLIIFGVSLFYILIKHKFKADSSAILLLGLAIITLVYGRSASRIFFLITPFVCLIIAYSLIKCFELMKTKKEDLQKWAFTLLFIAMIIILLINIRVYYTTSDNQAKYFGPSMGEPWQDAAAWIRNSTPEGSVFVHWWDYGYWIEGVGKRPAVTDGGHAGGDDADHYIGRYILTTPNPESALSFMKTWNVSYLLIDQTDLGKYPAYSKIGSDDNFDRMSIIPVGVADANQVKETANSTLRVYQISGIIDEDIDYDSDGTEIFLPGPTYNSLGNPSYKSYILGVVLETENNKIGGGLKQPEAVFMYNNNQVRIPLRYVYMNGKTFDFKTGLDATIMIIPSVVQTDKGINIDQYGSAIYLSPKVNKGLFARLYLINDKSKEYEAFKLAKIADDDVVKILKKQGYNGDMVYYQGFRGPIKIWQINYPADIKEEPGFLKRSFTFADMDYLFY